MGIKEEVYFEGPPHWGDLIVNILLGFTVICLPLTVGAIVRALWLRYRITNRRVTITGGWLGRDRSDVIYSEIVKIVTVPRGIGLWGDMVLTLKDGNRLELKALPKFREVAAYIQDKIKSPSKAAGAAA
ncbi:PH domain-containing protein [Lyngbya confervoides]|uniref:PH domain-containing protein n=1 Tax=Lyngbya confervoides BDU141951 TaxID=1574623 RepID=A0ABD4T7P0_9CYAN|nr:PH domain-containing protein [Lyngbya confervoides]MCM1984789.1 PH domain-containing protein [Lyngbya confervoides BDU141951]